MSKSKSECPDCFNIGLAEEDNLIDLKTAGIPPSDLLKNMLLTGPDDTKIDFNGAALLPTNSTYFDLRYINNFGYPFSMVL